MKTPAPNVLEARFVGPLERFLIRAATGGRLPTAIHRVARRLAGWADVVISNGVINLCADKRRVFGEIMRVLRPGGRLLVLEFSRVWKPLEPAYDAYSFKVLPALGKLITNDSDSYRYLAESIRMHPDQETLKQMMLCAGLERVEYFNLCAGVVALHRGYRF